MVAKSKLLDTVMERIDTFIESKTKVALTISQPAYVICVEGYLVAHIEGLVLFADRARGKPQWKVAFKPNNYDEKKLTTDNGLNGILLTQRAGAQRQSGTQILLAEVTANDGVDDGVFP
jgi:hypothetical protein